MERVNRKVLLKIDVKELVTVEHYFLRLQELFGQFLPVREREVFSLREEFCTAAVQEIDLIKCLLYKFLLTKIDFKIYIQIVLNNFFQERVKIIEKWINYLADEIFPPFIIIIVIFIHINMICF